jgi:hypothetical protein
VATDRSQACLQEYNTKKELVLHHGKNRMPFHTVLITVSCMKSSVSVEAQLGDMLSAALTEGWALSNAERRHLTKWVDVGHLKKRTER